MALISTYSEYCVTHVGHDTKAMLNNSGPRYKRSKLERRANTDVLWCVLLLVIMCLTGALGRWNFIICWHLSLKIFILKYHIFKMIFMNLSLTPLNGGGYLQTVISFTSSSLSFSNLKSINNWLPVATVVKGPGRRWCKERDRGRRTCSLLNSDLFLKHLVFYKNKYYHFSFFRNKVLYLHNIYITSFWCLCIFWKVMESGWADMKTYPFLISLSQKEIPYHQCWRVSICSGPWSFCYR